MTATLNLSRLTILLTLVISLPAFVVFGAWVFPQWETWAHLSQTVLSDYISNTLILAFGVGIVTGLLGTWCAWCLSQYRFPLADKLRWMLFLPLAFPPYIMGYVYTGILEFSGPLQTALRSWTGWTYGEYWFPDVQSMPGAIFILSIVLFPYVYGLAYVAFVSQSQSLREVGQNHGLSHWQYFRKVALPLALPAIFTGMLLAMMEAFADFGTVEYLGISTFTTGIFRTWFGMNQPLVAAQLSAGLVCFVLFLVWLEKNVRRRQRYYQSRGDQQIHAENIPLVKRNLALLSLIIIFLITFCVPFLRLLSWAVLVIQEGPDYSAFIALLGNSLMVASSAAVMVMMIALVVSYAQRNQPTRFLKVISAVATSGYAFPGAVIAVGTVMVLGKADLSLNHTTDFLFDWQPGLVFSGTLFALLFAYLIRYLTVGYQHVQNGLSRISPSLDQVSKTLGEHDFGILRKVHFPLLRASLLVGLLMVFVDVLKELPATLILRPFNFDTLAVKTYELASDERLTDASLPALFIVMAGLIPVWFIQKNIKSN